MSVNIHRSWAYEYTCMQARIRGYMYVCLSICMYTFIHVLLYT